MHRALVRKDADVDAEGEAIVGGGRVREAWADGAVELEEAVDLGAESRGLLRFDSQPATHRLEL